MGSRLTEQKYKFSGKVEPGPPQGITEPSGTKARTWSAKCTWSKLPADIKNGLTEAMPESIKIGNKIAYVDRPGRAVNLGMSCEQALGRRGQAMRVARQIGALTTRST